MAKPIPCDSNLRRNGSMNLAEPIHQLREGEPSEVPADDGLEPVDLGDWGDEPVPDVATLIHEKEQLHEQLAEAQGQVNEIKKEAEQLLAEQQREYENLLEEKSETIRTLHRKIHEQPERPAPVNVPREEELLALSEELERERQQLKEDEEALMQQMGQMEVQMSRERAELARQRTELQRLQSEIRHELEQASRDAALRERLAPLQRRQQEMAHRTTSGPESPVVPESRPPAREEPQPRDSGLFRRLFG